MYCTEPGILLIKHLKYHVEIKKNNKVLNCKDLALVVIGPYIK